MYSIFRDAKLQREVNSKTKRETENTPKMVLFICLYSRVDKQTIRMNYIENAAKIIKKREESTILTYFTKSNYKIINNHKKDR